MCGKTQTARTEDNESAERRTSHTAAEEEMRLRRRRKLLGRSRRCGRRRSEEETRILMGINAPRKILQPEPNPSGPGQAGQTKVRSSHINTG